MPLVESKNNSRVKYVKKLARRRFRDREGKFVLEGFRAVEEVLKLSGTVEFILFSPSARATSRGEQLFAAAREAGIAAVEVAENIMRDLAGTETPQGVLAVVCRREVSLDDILSTSPSLLVLVDGVQDPGNLGTIVRTSAGAGAQGLILLPGTVDLYNPKTLRSTMGNIFKLPVVMAGQRSEVLKKIRNAGLELVVGDPRAEKAVFEIDLTGPVVIAVGNEARGVQEDILMHSRHRVHIPMSAGVDSLNVAVAAGIMLYEVVRQRYN